MISFNNIRHKIQEHRKLDILQKCYSYLDSVGNAFKPVWDIFLLMKWTYLYAEQKYPYKPFTDKDFNSIVNLIPRLSDDHVSSFMKSGELNKAFNVLYSQQFYLQKRVHEEVFATQLKLYSTLRHKHNIEAIFSEKTGLSIFDFTFLMSLTWVFINQNKVSNEKNYKGYLSNDFLNICAEMTSITAVKKFIHLLTLTPSDAKEKIETYKRGISKKELQSLEISFFTMFPFQIHREQIRVIHSRIFDYSSNYFIHDFLKANDMLFGAEFGKRFEKYIALGLKEINQKFKTENEIKKLLSKTSNVCDFLLEDDNIVIECKAIELQPYTSINPTDELLNSSLKDSLIKAYSKQMLSTARLLNDNVEKWGIILTYKQLFWSRFSDIWKVAKRQEGDEINSVLLPAENVYIIDIYAWNEIIQIVKEKKASLTELLQKAKSNNLKPETSKQLFEMHLEEYKIRHFDLKFLEKEIKKLQIRLQEN